MGIGVGGVLGVFLLEFTQPVEGHPEDSQLWVVVGDIPSVYLDTGPAPDAATALDIYCDLMEDWAGKILGTRDAEEVYPVDAAPTEGNAKDLESRIHFIRTQILPQFR